MEMKYVFLELAAAADRMFEGRKQIAPEYDSIAMEKLCIPIRVLVVDQVRDSLETKISVTIGERTSLASGLPGNQDFSYDW